MTARASAQPTSPSWRNTSSRNIPPRTARNLVGRTVAEVERDLILETLKHCLGNRTHAANILGISIRTLRNKLNEYSAEGTPIPPPNGGDPLRGAA
jgi:two-component system, response regulator FlrC